MRLGGGGAGERRALDPERQGGHVGSLWATLHLRQVPLRPQVRGHASGAARASDDAVEQGAVVVPPQNHLRRHQDPLAPRVLRDGMFSFAWSHAFSALYVMLEKICLQHRNT